ncbi:MAG: LysR family transcriptional regulator [Pseudomonadota bacterium]
MVRDSQPVQIGSIELFLKAAEFESFAGAAEVAGVTPAAVSRSIARLEDRLGVRLFIRSTRKVSLTDDGRTYAEQCRNALGVLQDAEDALTGRQGVPKGDLRISVPTTYGHYRLLPLLTGFARLHPSVTIEINIDNRNIDLYDAGYDLAVRLGEPADSRLIARKLEDAALGVYAAPSYLAEFAPPETLADLQHHHCIQFVLPSTGRPMRWSFVEDEQERDVSVKAQVRLSHDVTGCISYAAVGGGLYQTYDFLVADRVQRGELVEVLTAYRGRSRPFYLLYPQNRHLASKVRAFVDYLIAQIKTEERIKVG